MQVGLVMPMARNLCDLTFRGTTKRIIYEGVPLEGQLPSPPANENSGEALELPVTARDYQCVPSTTSFPYRPGCPGGIGSGRPDPLLESRQMFPVTTRAFAKTGIELPPLRCQSWGVLGLVRAFVDRMVLLSQLIRLNFDRLPVRLAKRPDLLAHTRDSVGTEIKPGMRRRSRDRGVGSQYSILVRKDRVMA